MCDVIYMKILTSTNMSEAGSLAVRFEAAIHAAALALELPRRRWETICEVFSNCYCPGNGA